MVENLRLSKIFFTGLALCLFASPVHSQASYYQGKTITMIMGGDPGGRGEMQIRALIPALKKYIPGEPHVVIQAMSGAAGRKAANHIYSVAKPDGLVIGALGGGLIPGPVLGLPGSGYDLDKFIYLGSTDSGDAYSLFTRKEAGLDNLEKLRGATGIRIGAQSVGHSVHVSARLFAYILGLKEPKFVFGFGGVELDLALFRGEVDARAHTIDIMLQRNPEVMEKGQVHIHATITVPRGNHHPRYPDIPDLDIFTKTEQERKLLAMYRALIYPRWPYILPPATPRELAATLRGAMAKALRDAEFQGEFNKIMGSRPTPLTAEQFDRAIKELPRDAETTKLYKLMADPGPLPPR